MNRVSFLATCCENQPSGAHPGAKVARDAGARSESSPNVRHHCRSPAASARCFHGKGVHAMSVEAPGTEERDILERVPDSLPSPTRPETP